MTRKEANQTGGNFYSEKGKETDRQKKPKKQKNQQKTKKSPEQNRTKNQNKTETPNQNKSGKRERERESERSEDNALSTESSPVRAPCDRTGCFKGSDWLTSPTPSKAKALSSLRLARKSLLPER